MSLLVSAKQYVLKWLAHFLARSRDSLNVLMSIVSPHRQGMMMILLFKVDENCMGNTVPLIKTD